MNEIDDFLKWNCSTIFLLYPLGLNRLKLSEYGFDSCYLKDEFNTTEYYNPVYLRFIPKDIGNFQVFVNEEYTRTNPNSGEIEIRDDYDRGDGSTCLVYEFPQVFDKDYKKFLKGKYSQFSGEITKTYPKTIKVKDKGKENIILGSAYRIITKDKDSEGIMTGIYGQKLIIDQPIKTMADLLEERFGTPFTSDMEVWSVPNLDKETLKL